LNSLRYLCIDKFEDLDNLSEAFDPSKIKMLEIGEIKFKRDEQRAHINTLLS
jgi:hypothetical protein